MLGPSFPMSESIVDTGRRMNSSRSMLVLVGTTGVVMVLDTLCLPLICTLQHKSVKPKSGTSFYLP